MLERIWKVIYFVMLAVLVLFTFAVCIFNHGLVGIFTAIGMLLAILIAMAFIESSFKWFVTGEFQFPAE